MSLPQTLIRPRRVSTIPPELVAAPIRRAPSVLSTDQLGAPPPPPPAPTRPSVIDPSLVPKPFAVDRLGAPPPPAAPSAPAMIDQSLTVRPRQLNPPDELTLDRDYIHQLQTAPVVADERDPQTGEYVYPGAQHKPSRGRAFLMTALKAFGPSIANARAEAYAQGRAPGWDTLAAGAAGALGGGVVGAINPTIPLQMERDYQIKEAQRRFSEDAERAGKQANIDYIRARPGIAYGGLQTKREIAAAGNATKVYGIDQRTDAANHATDVRAQGVVGTTTHQARADFLKSISGLSTLTPEQITQARALGLPLDAEQWAQSQKEKVPYTQVYAEDGSVYRVPRKGVGGSIKVTDEHGAPIFSEQTARDVETAETQQQNANSNTTRAGAAVTNAGANVIRASRPPAQRGTANIQGQAQKEINRLQGLYSARGKAYGREREALDANIQSAEVNIRTRFGSVVEDDGQGRPMRIKPQASPAKAQLTPPPAPRSRRGGQQRVATQADVAEYARRTGVDVGRAAEHFRASGYAIQ